MLSKTSAAHKPRQVSQWVSPSVNHACFSCYNYPLPWAWTSTCSRPTALPRFQICRRRSPSRTSPAWRIQLLLSPKCWKMSSKWSKKTPINSLIYHQKAIQYQANVAKLFIQYIYIYLIHIILKRWRAHLPLPQLPGDWTPTDSPQVGAATHGTHDKASLTFHHLLRAQTCQWGVMDS